MRAPLWAGFTVLGVRRVLARTMTINAGSRRVLVKVGLRFVRTFHESWPEPVDGSEYGDVEYVLTRQEWASDPGSRPESTCAAYRKGRLGLFRMRPWVLSVWPS